MIECGGQVVTPGRPTRQAFREGCGLFTYTATPSSIPALAFSNELSAAAAMAAGPWSAPIGLHASSAAASTLALAFRAAIAANEKGWGDKGETRHARTRSLLCWCVVSGVSSPGRSPTTHHHTPVKLVCGQWHLFS